ncbi:MAG: hypothetical protein KIT83_03525 [Bryobacterales bacterium]|nr:hypothetical protein [Bryobacterales bacterium]
MVRKSFLLRIDAEVHDALKRWADDELRSLNGQIEFLLRRALIERKRLRQSQSGSDNEGRGASSEDD